MHKLYFYLSKNGGNMWKRLRRGTLIRGAVSEESTTLCLSVRWWLCWDFRATFNSPTTFISQTTQVAVPSADTADKWIPQTQISRRLSASDDIRSRWLICSRSFLSAVSPWCPRHSGGVNCPPPPTLFSLRPWMQLPPDEVTVMWVLGEVTNFWELEAEKDADWETRVDEEATDKGKRSETKTTGCPIAGEVRGAPLWYSGVWAGTQRWGIVECWRQGKDSCSSWVYVGGRQTKGGKSASVLSDAGGQRALWMGFVLVLPLSSRLQRKETERTQHGGERWKKPRRIKQWRARSG